MEGSRERGLREHEEAAVSPVSFASSTAQNKAIHQHGHSLLRTRPQEYQFTALQSTLVSVRLAFRFQTSNLKEILAFSVELLHRCYGAAAFMFDDNSGYATCISAGCLRLFGLMAESKGALTTRS